MTMYTADRTWPQLVCYALVAPSVLISEGEYWEDWNGIEQEEQETRLIFKLENYQVTG